MMMIPIRNPTNMKDGIIGSGNIDFEIPGGQKHEHAGVKRSEESSVDGTKIARDEDDEGREMRCGTYTYSKHTKKYPSAKLSM